LTDEASPDDVYRALPVMTPLELELVLGLRTMSAARSLEGKRVLVIEDNYLIAEALCDAMRAAGAVAVGPTGAPAEAIKLATLEELDGALLDVQLQESDSRQVAEYLRSRIVPVVLVTGHARSSLDPGLQDLPYLSKPTLLSDIVEQVAACSARGTNEISPSNSFPTVRAPSSSRHCRLAAAAALAPESPSTAAVLAQPPPERPPERPVRPRRPAYEPFRQPTWPWRPSVGLCPRRLFWS
jgi:CheY-like chemotaxis protein